MNDAAAFLGAHLPEFTRAKARATVDFDAELSYMFCLNGGAWFIRLAARLCAAGLHILRTHICATLLVALWSNWMHLLNTHTRVSSYMFCIPPDWNFVLRPFMEWSARECEFYVYTELFEPSSQNFTRISVFSSSNIKMFEVYGEEERGRGKSE